MSYLLITVLNGDFFDSYLSFRKLINSRVDDTVSTATQNVLLSARIALVLQL